jgi:hypothetical protein
MCSNFWKTKISLCFPTKFIILNIDYFPTRHFMSGFIMNTTFVVNLGIFMWIYEYIITPGVYQTFK